MKVIIGYDGSSCSDAALQDLDRAGLPPDVEALVVSVSEYWLPPPSSYALVETDFSGAHGTGMREATELAAVGRDIVLGFFPQWQVRAEARGGSPARQLLELADEWKPDLFVLGSHGRTGLAKYFLGSISQRIATEATNSVRIARGRIEGQDAAIRIILGIDGSEGCQAAARAVLARTWKKGTHVKLVTAMDSLPLEGRELRDELERIHALHNPVLERLWTSGLEATSLIHQANPRELLLREAEEWSADCIFLGATGLHALERTLFGSVVTAVTARAHCSVEIVRERH